MRLWTLHPRYLDPKGLVALWREALLAQKVISGKTRGYTRHPQLIRFQAQAQPMETIAAFLSGVADEATRRGYQFDRSRILVRPSSSRIIETRGQLLHEWIHLQQKLERRAPLLVEQFTRVSVPKPHPLFQIVRGEIRDWEKSIHLDRIQQSR